MTEYERTDPMYDPPHPGEFLSEMYLAPLGLSARALATKLGVSASSLTRVLNGESRITTEMALRLSKALGASAESWLRMQEAYDLWHARQAVNLDEVQVVELKSA